jgi:hypothetical protein
MIHAYFIGGPLDLTKRVLAEQDANSVMFASYSMHALVPRELKELEAGILPKTAINPKRALYRASHAGNIGGQAVVVYLWQQDV